MEVVWLILDSKVRVVGLGGGLLGSSDYTHIFIMGGGDCKLRCNPHRCEYLRSVDFIEKTSIAICNQMCNVATLRAIYCQVP